MGWEAEESHSAERRWRVVPKTGGGAWREEETESNVEMKSDAGVEFRMGGHITPKTVRESSRNRDYGHGNAWHGWHGIDMPISTLKSINGSID